LDELESARKSTLPVQLRVVVTQAGGDVARLEFGTVLVQRESLRLIERRRAGKVVDQVLAEVAASTEPVPSLAAKTA
jgi:hypothetical protein